MKKITGFLMLIGWLTTNLVAWELPGYGNLHFERMGKSNVWIMHGPPEEPSVKNRGFMNNPAFIESAHSLIVIDPGGNYNVGKRVLAEIEKVSHKPIIAVLNTHKHGDHWFANQAIAEKYPKTPIYAHPNMIKEVKAGEGQKWYGILDRLSHNLAGTKPFRYPDHELTDGQKITIDGQHFVIHHPKKAHTDTDILIEHLESKTLFLGDNVMKNRLGGFDDSSSILGNIELLEGIMKNGDYALYVPGHGPSGAKEETVGPYLRYLKVLKKWAQKAYDNDEDYYAYKKEAIKELGPIAKWDAFDHQMGKHLNKVYMEIEAKDME
jgi:glyoxylase-like metal-dependent hydrolase (beta-lactamase superfamily II)